MRSVITLYHAHDGDLLALYQTVGLREFGRLLKEALRILARPDYIPKHKPPFPLVPYGEEKNLRLYLTVKAEKDRDIEELLSHVKYRRLGAFCKMAMRFYLGPRDVMGAMMDIALVPAMTYVPTGYIVASVPAVLPAHTGRRAAVSGREESGEEHRVGTGQNVHLPDRAEDTTFKAHGNSFHDLADACEQGTNTVADEDEEDVLALLESLMD